MSNALQLLLDRAVANTKFKMQKLDHARTDDLVELTQNTQALFLASKDLRTIATAIGHGISTPLKGLAALATAQAVSPSGLRRRYPVEIIEPLTQLNNGDSVDAKGLVDSLESLLAADLLSIDERLDHSIESAFGAASPSALVKELVQRRLIASLPRFSELLKDPSWTVNVTPSPMASVRKDDAYTLLGEIFHTLSFAETATEYRAWTGLGGATASLEWEGGPSIDQVLAIIMPLENDGVLLRGVRGLWLRDFDAAMTSLTWSHNGTTVNLRLIRA